MLVPVMILAVLSVVGGFIQTRALGIGPSQVSDFLRRSRSIRSDGRRTRERSSLAS